MPAKTSKYAVPFCAERNENELTIALRVVTNLIEPAMIIVMAMLVGFLLFSVLSAMFSITASIQH